MRDWLLTKALIRELFAGDGILKFKESSIIDATETGRIFVHNVASDFTISDGGGNIGNSPAAREVQVVLHYLMEERDAQAVADQLDSAYHTAGDRALGHFGSDILGCQRLTQEAEQHPQELRVIAGTEIWLFGK